MASRRTHESHAITWSRIERPQRSNYFLGWPSAREIEVEGVQLLNRDAGGRHMPVINLDRDCCVILAPVDRQTTYYNLAAHRLAHIVKVRRIKFTLDRAIGQGVVN